MRFFEASKILSLVFFLLVTSTRLDAQSENVHEKCGSSISTKEDSFLNRNIVAAFVGTGVCLALVVYLLKLGANQRQRYNFDPVLRLIEPSMRGKIH